MKRLISVPLIALMLTMTAAFPVSAEVYHHWSEVPAEVQAEHSPEVIQGWIDAYWVNEWVQAYNRNRWYEVAAANARADAAREAAARSSANVVWDRLAQCESGGNWSINTGNGYSGGLQFHPRTWTGYGGRAYATYAYQATREQQIEIARKVQAGQGWGAWPACSRKIGLR